MPMKRITKEEGEKLTIFRSNVSDLLVREEQHKDYYLIRWLRARNLDVQKAETMFRESMRWREENKVDGILERLVDDVPLKYKRMYPTGNFGQTVEGDPVICLPLGRFNHRVGIGEVGLPTFLKYNIVWIESLMSQLQDYEKEKGVEGLQFIEIVDMEYYSFKELTFKIGREFIVESQKVFEANYPEVLRSVLIINAPKIFSMIFSMVKPLLPKETLNKMDIHGHGGAGDESSWKVIIKDSFNPSAIPIRWGGTLAGDDIFCSQDTSVWSDGPIPLAYFTQDDIDEDGLKRVKVGARDKLKLNLKVGEKGSELRWRFRTESHDIGFGILDPEGEEALTQKRFESHNSVQEGSIVCSVKGEYLVVFDNSFSYTKSKILSYHFEVLDPESIIQLQDAQKPQES